MGGDRLIDESPHFPNEFAATVLITVGATGAPAS
jgi:hypothetical protein